MVGSGSKAGGAMGRVIGVDGCRSGWVGIGLADRADGSEDAHGYFGRTISELVDRATDDGPLGVVAIDIPIGLPHDSMRTADALARRQIGALAPSVFATPVRDALLAASHAEAVRINRELTGVGISVQAYSLRRKILEVDDWVTECEDDVIEIHPELSFAMLAGRPLATRKSSWAGAEE